MVLAHSAYMTLSVVCTHILLARKLNSHVQIFNNYYLLYTCDLRKSSTNKYRNRHYTIKKINGC